MSPVFHRLRIALVVIALGVPAFVVSAIYSRPKTWPVSDVPIAFWAWRNNSPSEADLRNGIEITHARAIFLRAGQIDYRDGNLSRIRSVNGPLPKGIELHLVYNATRPLLSQLESIDEVLLANVLSKTFKEDLSRAANENARVVGVQLDLDVPTRLLPRYRKTVIALRGELPAGVELSITGLPTWMESPELSNLLKTTDFWVPQFYGAQVPERSDQLIPISSHEAIERDLRKTRELDTPFYAGLAAYGWALLYSATGSLITLRGDIDPAVVASASDLELIDEVSQGGELRRSYRAQTEEVIDGLTISKGDVLVVHVPTVESLRTAARAVRELGGAKLRGICVFRLPSRDDRATLGIAQVATALADQAATSHIETRIVKGSGGYQFEWTNLGTTSARVGTFQAQIAVPPGSIESVTSQTGISVEMMCDHGGGRTPRASQRCSQRRANTIQLHAETIAPGQVLRALVVLDHGPLSSLPVFVKMEADNGTSFSKQGEVSVESK